MSSRIRVPERESDFSWEEPYRSGGGGGGRSSGGGGRRRRPPSRRGRGAGPRQVALPLLGVALVVGLLIGFLAGGSGGTTTVTETATVTTEAAEQAPTAAGPGSRATIALTVLNGSGENGLAASTAERLTGLGYRNVTEGNAPSQVTADRVLYRPGSEPLALQVAADLDAGAPLPLADATGIAEAAPDADVVAVMGPSAGGDTGQDTAEAPALPDEPAGDGDVDGVGSGEAGP
ncbi:MAG: LytR C-terminal domain-containing protein [Miltoncostaeaceae bacterium]